MVSRSNCAQFRRSTFVRSAGGLWFAISVGCLSRNIAGCRLGGMGSFEHSADGVKLT